MIPGGRRGLLIALVSFALAPGGARAQPAAVPAQPEHAPAEAPPPAPTPPATAPSATGVQTPQPPPQQQGAEEGAKVLGRQRPAAMVTPPPRPDAPDVSVSVVSPQKPSVFGRRTRVGSEPRGMSGDDRGATEGFGETMGEEPEAPAE